ncbi:large conductance mechanosensitive channel protein MscL [Enterococcus alcedinis]|uniref:Large-conductance mechanosensitive channel n=1 Tax=Enterococcus alcedinis TaxID=1274384 RepID=A0A917JFS1_9ENTE|nr:large conductance mechanosensitive channel protein MscL [Enterococcus alcedinis]MBP2102880.1 large conductance mechanosensitive channel [Enterococcus alcedinis]GGI66458.1 large-conductance mechanosensitive channel [Enterococcus alcedinis]
MKKLGSEFKEFIIKGDALNLAIGVVIGAAFTGIVTAIVDNLITPLIELFISLFIKGDMNDALSVLTFSVNGVKFEFSVIVSAIITFLITGFVLFLVVKSVNHAKALTAKKVEEEEEITYTSEDYLKEIRDLLQANADKNK